MSLMAMPNEIHRIISSQLSYHDNNSLLRVSRHLGSIYKQLLYTSVSKDNGGQRALHFVIRNGNVDLLKALVNEYSASIEATDNLKMTSLHLAAKYNQSAAAKFLLESGADVAALCYEKEGAEKADMPPLHVAAFSNSRDVIHVLVRDFDVPVDQGPDCTALHHAANTTGEDETVSVLLDYGADINAKCVDVATDWTPLMWAVNAWKESTVKLLLLKGADVNASTAKDGETSLQNAVLNGQENLCEILLQHGANPNAVMTGVLPGFAPLHIAVTRGRPEIIPTLIKYGADLNPSGTGGGGPTPLALAAACFQVRPDIEIETFRKSTKLLVEAGADINAVDIHGHTILRNATLKARNPDKEILMYLREHGAKMYIEDEGTDEERNLPTFLARELSKTVTESIRWAMAER